MIQEDLIKRITSSLSDDKEIRGAWLSGSFGRGDEDEFSDVDVVALVEDGKAVQKFDEYASKVSNISPILYQKTLPPSQTVNVITPNWLRFDITFVEKDKLFKMSKDELRTLFDKDDLFKELSDSKDVSKQPPPNPADIVATSNEFLRVLGLMPVAIKRGEHVVGQSGSQLLHSMLVRVMVAENAPQPIRGALSLSKSLTNEQLSRLESLPPISADPAAIMTANKAIAEEFLPRARAIVDKSSEKWPEEFESQTLAHLKSSLNLEVEIPQQKKTPSIEK